MPALLRSVTPKDEYPQVEETVRPYRLWDSEGKCYVPHRFYATERRALDQALLLVRWEKVGTTYEVLDVANGTSWIGTYARRVHSIEFTGR